MKERLLIFLKNENKSSAQLAEEIGVQASGISHILSGRNNPSLDFVLKMLEKYKFLSTDWLLFGKGPMYKDSGMKDLFNQDFSSSVITADIEDNNEKVKQGVENKDVNKTVINKDHIIKTRDSSSDVVKIVWFFEDNSFEEYFPRG
jgi:transcriptional regulator with XRE-family HTH domain